MEPELKHILNFLDDEGLGPLKTFGEDTQKWKIVFNEPWIPDSKMRCAITKIYPKWSNDKGVIVFNSYKATALLGDGYKGLFWKFVCLIKGIEGIKPAKRWFIMKYMLHDTDTKKLLDIANTTTKHHTEDSKSTDIIFPEEFERLDPKNSTHLKFVNYLSLRRIPKWRWNDMKIFVDKKDSRIVFPTYDNGKMIFYTKRSIKKNSVVPWISYKSQDWTYPIWNLDNVDGETVVLFEAVFDAAMVHNGVAILGASNTAEEIVDKILKKNFVKIIVAMDNDDAGEKSRLKIAEALGRKHSNVWIYDYEGIKEKDFNNMVMNDIEINMGKKIIRYGIKSQLAKKMKII